MEDILNKICVYAICKNEIKFVDSWLNSMQEADYIVVLDTGSTDGTYERLKSDSRVTRVEQEVFKKFRFDVARNKSLELVPEDANILICTDLDEVFEPNWTNLIRDNWTRDTWRGRYSYVWSHNGDGSNGMVYTYDKLHAKGYKWVYPCHEVLMPPGGFEVLEKEELDHTLWFDKYITLHHYPDNEKGRGFYMDLLKTGVKENPEDAYQRLLLGREYAHIGDFSKAKKELNKVFTLQNVKPIMTHHAMGLLCDVCLAQQDYCEAVKYIHMQISKDKTYREPYMKLAEIYNMLGMYDVAVSVVETAIKSSTRHFDWTEDEKAWSYQPYDILGVSYYYLNEPDKGIENALKALRFNPMDERLQKNYLAVLSLKE